MVSMLPWCFDDTIIIIATAEYCYCYCDCNDYYRKYTIFQSRRYDIHPVPRIIIRYLYCIHKDTHTLHYIFPQAFIGAVIGARTYTLHYITLHYITLHYITLHTSFMPLCCTPPTLFSCAQTRALIGWRHSPWLPATWALLHTIYCMLYAICYMLYAMHYILHTIYYIIYTI